jgi:hypothetical protein
VRAIVPPGAGCPSASTGAAVRDMMVRPPATRAQFDVMLCEVTLDANEAERLAGVALRDGRFLTLSPRRRVIESVVIIGDTGCRQSYYAHQGCNDPSKWPFARVAQRAAQARPDLVIHVGDYLYREKPCPDADAACAGSPWGDNWPTWRADFFEPARMLLAAAPWVAVRGNHENCARAGQGWLHFLALRPQSGAPEPYRIVTGPVRLDFDNLALTVLDSASIGDPIYETDDGAAYAAMCGAIGAYRRDLRESGDRLHLLALHHPSWRFDDRAEPGNDTDAAYSPDGGKVDPAVVRSRELCARWASAAAAGESEPEPPTDGEALMVMPRTTIRAMLGGIAGEHGAATVVSGHEHNFQSIFLAADKSLPVHQLVVGNGGTKRSKIAVPIGDASNADGRVRVATEACLKRTSGDPRKCDRGNFEWLGRAQAVAHAFGFMHLKRFGDVGWSGIARDLEDRPMAVCAFPTSRERMAAVADIVASLAKNLGRDLPALNEGGCAVLPS